MTTFTKRSISAMLIIFTIATMLSFAGCGGEADNGGASSTSGTSASTTAVTTSQGTPEDQVNSYKKSVYKLQDIADKINVLGRCVIGDAGLTADWSASGFEFVADCKNFVKITISSTKPCRFNFYMDDAEMKAIDVIAGKKTYTLANNIEAGVHSFRFVKSSAVEYATEAIAVDIESIEIYGEINEAAKRDYLIEFVGDSITCGVGALSPSTTEAYSELSYAYLTANKLNTDYSIVAVSGIGAGKSTDRHKGVLMGDIYPLTNYYRSKTETYTTERKADLVVINLNTNDKGSFATNQKEEFTEKIKELIDQVKAIHGDDVKIVWVMGMMSDPAYGNCDVWTVQYFGLLGGEAAGYYCFYADKNNAGASSHPISTAHETNAQKLADFITSKNILG